MSAAAGVGVFFLLPPRDDVTASDVVVVMAGATDGRHELGARLVEEGVAPHFVVSNGVGDADEAGAAHCRGDKRPARAHRIWCMTPFPDNTAGEAMTLTVLARDQGWTSATVVTNRPHTRRVRSVYERCTQIEVAVVPVQEIDSDHVIRQISREIGGFLKFWFTRPCG